MPHWLKRHPLEVQAFFRHSLVLTYAMPAEVLEPLLPPGLVLDTFEGCGFLAIALVQTRALRSRGMPAWMGRHFFLSGYRIFTRLGRAGASLRGLYILRSDTDSRWMAWAGNLLTHYRYELARVRVTEGVGRFAVEVRTPGGAADLDVSVVIDGEPAALPEGSPFPDLAMARKFAGPLPYTFDFESATHSIIKVRGVRDHWDPQPVRATVTRCAFLGREPFRAAGPRLANAFYLRDVEYRWERGVRVPA